MRTPIPKPDRHLHLSKAFKTYLFWMLQNCHRGLSSVCHMLTWCLATEFCFYWLCSQQIWRLVPLLPLLLLGQIPHIQKYPLKKWRHRGKKSATIRQQYTLDIEIWTSRIIFNYHLNIETKTQDLCGSKIVQKEQSCKDWSPYYSTVLPYAVVVAVVVVVIKIWWAMGLHYSCQSPVSWIVSVSRGKQRNSLMLIQVWVSWQSPLRKQVHRWYRNLLPYFLLEFWGGKTRKKGGIFQFMPKFLNLTFS